MKNKVFLFPTLFVLLISLFSFRAMATEDVQSWSSSETTKTITVVEGNGVSFRYTPKETGEYAIKYSRDVPLDHDVNTADGEYLEFENWMDDQMNSYDIYQLTKGKEYIIQFFYSGPDSRYNGKYTGKVSLSKWDNKLLLPDYPYIKNDEKKTVSLGPEESVFYLFAPSASGTYCLGHNTSNIIVGLSPLPQKVNEAGHDPEPMGEWHTDTQEGQLYHLEKGNVYLLAVSGRMHGDKTTDTVWIRQGEAPKNEYEVWDIKTAKTVTLKRDGVVKYYLTPTETGRYMVRKQNGFRFTVCEGDEEIGVEFETSDVWCMVFDLVAGREYVFSIQEWGSFAESVSGEFRFEKVGAVKSANIYVALFDQDGYILGLITDPLCGGVDGVEWGVSDPSVFSITESYPGHVRLKVLKKGKATITAKVGGVTASMELSSEHKTPVITEGKLFNMTIQNIAGAEFTPIKTGKYRFTVTPQDTVAFYLYAGDPKQDEPIYGNYEIAGKTVFTMDLNAGHTYTMLQISGKSSVLIEAAGGASAPSTTAKPATSVTTTTAKPATSAQSTTAKPTTTSQTTVEQTNDTTTVDTTESKATTKPSGGDADNHISEKDMTAAIDKTTDNTLSFAVNKSSDTIRIDADALRKAADAGHVINLNFAENISVQLDNTILKSIRHTADGEFLLRVACPVLSDLNEKQQATLKGKDTALIINLSLTADGKNIHQLGGEAVIRLPNPDASKNWQVLYVAEDGSVESVTATYGETIVFSTDHFSHYALVASNEITVADNNIWILPTILILLVVCGGAVLFFILKSKKAHALEEKG
ncbi:MAG: hypothetical protein IJO76_04090 [Clostridia bacterium]|nr:hypothetical protein [Clostridia bacterium]